MHLYTPILQIKEGELKALEELDSADKSKIIPMIQLLPDQNPDRIGDYVTDRLKPLLRGWTFFDNRIYVDPFLLGDSNDDLMRRFFDKFKEGNIVVVPVVRPDTTPQVKSFFMDYLVRGICLRISGSNVSADIINETTELYRRDYSLSNDEIDLLIDYGAITPENEVHFYNSFELLFSRIKSPEAFRKLIIAAGSFPFDLGKLSKDSVTAIPRTEWGLWKRIKALAGKSVNLLYADYGNVYPVYNEENSKRRGTCSIKYTDTDNFYVFKGERAENSPISTGQYREKAKDLITKPFYSGNMFSWGDGYILDCAQSIEKPGAGGSTTWVKITQNHHFVKMLRLLENLSQSG